MKTRLHISVCHLPPGTSKWNKIEHRLFSFISQNWRGKPLVSHEVIVNLIAATTTQTGLKVRAKLDTNSYPPGAKVSKKADRSAKYSSRLVPRRMELYNSSQYPWLLIHLFHDEPLGRKSRAHPSLWK
jgi:hypothetical protein